MRLTLFFLKWPLFAPDTARTAPKLPATNLSLMYQGGRGDVNAN
jgi:hypothetical protein